MFWPGAVALPVDEASSEGLADEVSVFVASGEAFSVGVAGVRSSVGAEETNVIARQMASVMIINFIVMLT